MGRRRSVGLVAVVETSSDLGASGNLQRVTDLYPEIYFNFV
jgi:hypothetical protein